ncbi:MAG: class I SAM-dependent methyltransferase [Provencibacterium sp.]|nr:class I SAM-dependent methyltransferase [Provencibacterium sp.]
MQFERTFDNAAKAYDESRPLYAPALYSDLFSYQPLDAGSRVLEIGLGTGKAAGPILKTGCRLTGVEPGGQLAALAEEKFRDYPNFELQNKTLQEYQCEEGCFSLIYSATAFHWIPEEYGYRRVYALLSPGGTFARFAYHAGQDRGRAALTQEIEALYSAHMPRSGEYREFTKQDAEKLARLAEGYGFIETRWYLYSVTKDFTAGQYMQLLSTYPNHMSLPEESRRALFEGIYEAIEKHGGKITVYYTMDLELARKSSVC